MATTLNGLEARQTEARSRARMQGVKVNVVRQGREYTSRSQSEAGVIYRISRTAQGWACGCKGYEFTGMCKHIAAVERRSEREGWAFGRVQRPEPAKTPDTSAGLALLMGRS